MRSGVLGSPVAHSLSPVLHAAAHAALGLVGWTYERVECDAEGLPGWIAARDVTWVGVSVTMPGKHAALHAAATATPRARAVGAANTLVRGADGSWSADCTDVDGVAGALAAAEALHVAAETPRSGVDGRPDHAGPAGPGPGPADGPTGAVVLGAGGTAAAAVHGLAARGVTEVSVVVREPARARAVLSVAEALGLPARAVRWDRLTPDDLAGARALVSTAPAGAADALAGWAVAALPPTAILLDAVYHPWPTPLAAAGHARGLAVATGLDMLLHQAFGQVEQFTDRGAPRAAMRAALEEVTGHRLLDPDLASSARNGGSSG